MYKVLIADDSASTRLALEKIIEKSPFFKVIGVAFDGEEVLRKVQLLKPDILTLDLNMPKLNGLEVLKILMQKNPLPVVIVSSITSINAKETLKALELGAVDFIQKPSYYPSSSNIHFETELIYKLKEAARANLKARGINIESKNITLANTNIQSKFELIVIGVSTGGPSTLKKIVSNLPQDFPIPIIIAQHIPEGLSSLLVESLNKVSSIIVKEAKDGDMVIPHRILIVPSNYQTILKQRYQGITIKTLKPQKQDIYIPSIDLLFSSATDIYKDKVIGIILTGMGNDGLEGAKKIKENKGLIIAESEQTAIIYGMPKVIIENNLADYILPLHKIIPKVLDIIY